MQTGLEVRESQFVADNTFFAIMAHIFTYAIQKQGKARNAPSRGLWMP